MNFHFYSVLEQFLLLDDVAFANLPLLIINPIINFIAILPLSTIDILPIQSLSTDVFFYNDLVKRFNCISLITQIPDLFDNIVLNLINIQYYKLNFFLIFFVSSMAFYTTLVFPKTIFQLLIEKSHIMAQQILKPIFGSHYPFTIRFINIIHFYIIYFYLFYLIIC